MRRTGPPWKPALTAALAAAAVCISMAHCRWSKRPIMSSRPFYNAKDFSSRQGPPRARAPLSPVGCSAGGPGPWHHGVLGHGTWIMQELWANAASRSCRRSFSTGIEITSLFLQAGPFRLADSVTSTPYSNLVVSAAPRGLQLLLPHCRALGSICCL